MAKSSNCRGRRDRYKRVLKQYRDHCLIAPVIPKRVLKQYRGRRLITLVILSVAKDLVVESISLWKRDGHPSQILSAAKDDRDGA